MRPSATALPLFSRGEAPPANLRGTRSRTTRKQAANPFHYSTSLCLRRGRLGGRALPRGPLGRPPAFKSFTDAAIRAVPDWRRSGFPPSSPAFAAYDPLFQLLPMPSKRPPFRLALPGPGGIRNRIPLAGCLSQRPRRKRIGESRRFGGARSANRSKRRGFVSALSRFGSTRSGFG